ncbi:hypothetical protein AB0383_46405 [Amycolatopsis sp. NPDC051373]
MPPEGTTVTYVETRAGWGVGSAASAAEATAQTLVSAMARAAGR